MDGFHAFAMKVSRIRKRIKFARYCLPFGDDDRFVANVMKIGKEYNLVELENFGEENSNNKIYHIRMEESHSGFFADHNKLLQYLYFSDKFGLNPVVEYSDKYSYAEKHGVNGINNPFEYYFLQPSEISLEMLKKEKAVLGSFKENTFLARDLNDKHNGYMRTENYLNEMARISRKYIRLNNDTSNKLKSDINKLLNNKKTLAVHVRGTDFKHNYNGHPVRIGTEEYLENTSNIFEREHYEQVFLATDDETAVNLFKSKFGNKVVFYKDVTRSSADETVMNSTSDRENHHFLLGMEVLRDMYTLSECNGLVAGLSQVSYAARIQKKSTGKDYEHLIILDKGINFHQKFNCPKT